MQTEILRSYNETREFREGHHAGHHARKTSARWSEETVDRWYRSMGREKPGRNGKTGGKQKRFPVLSSWSRLRSYIGHGKLMILSHTLNLFVRITLILFIRAQRIVSSFFQNYHYHYNHPLICRLFWLQFFFTNSIWLWVWHNIVHEHSSWITRSTLLPSAECNTNNTLCLKKHPRHFRL